MCRVGFRLGDLCSGLERVGCRQQLLVVVVDDHLGPCGVQELAARVGGEAGLARLEPRLALLELVELVAEPGVDQLQRNLLVLMGIGRVALAFGGAGVVVLGPDLVVVAEVDATAVEEVERFGLALGRGGVVTGLVDDEEP